MNILIGSTTINGYTDVFTEPESPLTEIYYKVRHLILMLNLVFSSPDYGYYQNV